MTHSAGQNALDLWNIPTTRTVRTIYSLMLRKIRICLGIVVLVAITFLFVDVSRFGAWHLDWLARIQILPAFMEGNVAVVASLLLATLVLGRVYCSVICPMGLMQDVVARLGLRAKPKRKYEFSGEKRALRLIVLCVFVASMAAGVGSVVALLAPYSSYGRIVQNLLEPAYRFGNNLLAMGAESADSYAFSRADVWVRAWPVFGLAALTFLAVGFLAWRHGRTYCNTICPIGTILGYVSKFSLLAPVIDGSKCSGCRKCERRCKAACIDIKGTRAKGRERAIDHSRCVACFNCIDNCERGAVRYTWRRHAASPAQTEPAPSPAPQPATGPDAGKRAFLAGLGAMATGAALAQQEKLVDGGLTILEDKRAPQRETPIVPPGARSLRNMSRKCTGCQLCVAKCPNGVLRPSTDLATFMQPHMSFERGYCRPECNACSQVCPAGAIEPMDHGTKAATQLGHAVWVFDRCVVNVDEVKCGNCARHCPNGAISMIPSPMLPDLRIPAVNEERCIGCGACEHVCPARPLSAIYVEGHENHKEI